MIRVEQLRKRFGEVRALDGISFEVSRGEVVGLLGPNGAGKTTAMRVVTGFLRPDSGSATVDGMPVSGDSIEARRRIGYLPENAPLYSDMDVVEHLDYIGRLRGMGKAERRNGVEEMVSVCGLAPVAARGVGGLSKGFRQRVGLAAAMLHRPEIIILDEPTSGLDPNQIAEIRNLIREMGRERTVVLSTHIMQEVEATCSRAIIINEGIIAGQGTIEELRGKSPQRSRYTIAARAGRERIAAELSKLAGISLEEWLSDPSDENQRLTLRGDDAGDRAEEIFRWAADNGIMLSELARSSNSLEQVFRELTQ
ncbi:MAG: ATP-binding cassette domain-containing protein, partial [Proteobacteria bacterium]|nr:ATP-binding cassette domain-containing protein [Pseudomonadota bacterium]